MDNQTTNQEPVNQTLPKEEIIPQEPIPQETPILETQAPEPQLLPQPEIKPEPEILSNEPTVPSGEYQKILDDYATTVKPQPEPELETPPKSPQEQLQDLGITAPPSTNNIFKIIFTIALVIFILVIIALGFTYFKSQKNSDSLNNNVVETTPTQAPISTEVCSLNDKTYQIGESFPSADGCNTCSCSSDLNIVCTEKACTPTPTSIATKSATKTATKSAIKLTITPTKTATSTSLIK
jgi:hypothetical protein